MKKRAVLYARVSTDEQADKGYSLPSQLDLCRKYAERLGFSIVAELREDHSGATPITERPEGKKLAMLLKTRQADTVIVYQVDRLSRDIVNLLAMVQMWIRAGIEVHTCDIGKIESELDIVLVIKGWQGSDERKKIRERSMRGKRAKAASGKVVCTLAPYGYELVRDANRKIVALAIHEERARIVRLIYNWYVYGDKDTPPLSQAKIIDRLNASGIPTPSKRSRQKGWNRPAINYILSNESYIGVWWFAKYRKLPHLRAEGEPIAVSIPSIIDRDTWERAQNRKEYNKQMSKRNGKYEYLLRGLLFCGECGQRMHGTNKRGKRFYYFCGSVRERSDHRCGALLVRSNVIEMQIWHGLHARLNDIAGLERDLRIAQQEEFAAHEPKREELTAIEATILQTQKHATELGRALSKIDSDGIVGQSLKQEIEQVNALYVGQTKRRDELQAELAEQKLTDQAVKSILQFAADTKAGIENAEASDKRRVIETLGVKVTIKGRHYYAKCLLGEWDEDILSLHAYRNLASSFDVARP